MILSDREIRAALERQAITITPDPTLDLSLWSSSALDLRLGDRVSLWDFTRPDAPACFSSADPDHNLVDLIDRFTQSQTLTDTGILLEPGSFILGWTQQTVQLPHRSRIAARVEGKSSLARLGMVSTSRPRRFTLALATLTEPLAGLAIPSSSRSGTPGRRPSA
jgi:dCTP deaminase